MDRNCPAVMSKIIAAGHCFHYEIVYTIYFAIFKTFLIYCTLEHYKIIRAMHMDHIILQKVWEIALNAPFEGDLMTVYGDGFQQAGDNQALRFQGGCVKMLLKVFQGTEKRSSFIVRCFFIIF